MANAQKASQKPEITREEHIARHKLLHKYLDELIADYLTCTGKWPSDTSVEVLMDWSYTQTINPTDPR